MIIIRSCIKDCFILYGMYKENCGSTLSHKVLLNRVHSQTLNIIKTDQLKKVTKVSVFRPDRLSVHVIVTVYVCT
jgi:hypothetical protein